MTSKCDKCGQTRNLEVVRLEAGRKKLVRVCEDCLIHAKELSREMLMTEKQNTANIKAKFEHLTRGWHIDNHRSDL
jgi:protein-arginine kinase activator protein McsA